MPQTLAEIDKAEAAAAAGPWRAMADRGAAALDCLTGPMIALIANAINAMLVYCSAWGTAMASLTVRRLDDKLKKQLRLRAARHSRSMEMRSASFCAGGGGRRHDILDTLKPPEQPARQKARTTTAGTRRVLLIIGGALPPTSRSI